MVSKLKAQKGVAATYILENQKQMSSADLKHSKAQQPLTY